VVTAELCPVCNGTNIAGNKWCYGPVTARHEKARFEFVEVVRASDLPARLAAAEQRAEEAERRIPGLKYNAELANRHMAIAKRQVEALRPLVERFAPHKHDTGCLMHVMHDDLYENPDVDEHPPHPRKCDCGYEAAQAALAQQGETP
jgi:uncharacterized coiled-coil protein SlyX